MNRPIVIKNAKRQKVLKESAPTFKMLIVDAEDIVSLGIELDCDGYEVCSILIRDCNAVAMAYYIDKEEFNRVCDQLFVGSSKNNNDWLCKLEETQVIPLKH